MTEPKSPFTARTGARLPPLEEVSRGAVHPLPLGGHRQDKEGEAYVLQRNDGKRIIPMLLFEDGTFLVEPTNAELAKKLGLTTEAKKTYYDLIIIGGGPAGLTAAILRLREGADVLLIERSSLGDRPASRLGWITSRVSRRHHRTGILERVVKQARRFNVEILQACGCGKTEMKRAITKSTRLMESIITRRQYWFATGASYRRWRSPARRISSARECISVRRVMDHSTRGQRRSSLWAE